MTTKRWPGYPRPAPIFYRLYYDAVSGRALFYSMEDVPGTYIDIDHETYQRNDSKIRVVDGRIEPLRWQTSTKLVPSTSGTACAPWSVAVIVGPHDPCCHWSLRNYEA
jgi:hypothetical protein